METIKRMKLPKKGIILLLLILLFGFGIRTFRVTLQEQPIFGDEAIYVRWSQVMRSEPTLRFLPLSDGKQPLFMWVAIPFFKLINDPLIAARMLSVFCGTAIVLGIFLLTLIIFNNWKISLIAAFVYAITPYAVFFDGMAIADSMLSMFGLYSLIFAIYAIRFKRYDFSMLSGFSLGAAFLTKSPSIFFAILLPSVLIYSERSDKKIVNIIKLILKNLMIILPVYFIAYAMYNILRLGPNFQMLSSRNLDYVYPIGHILTSPFNPLTVFLKTAFNWFWLLGPSLFIVIFLSGIFLNVKKRFKDIFLLSLWALFPIFVSAEYAKVFTARYIFFVVPYLCVIVSTIFLSSNYKNFLKMFFVIFLLHAIFVDFYLVTNIKKAQLPRSERSGYLEEWTAGYGIKEVSEYLKDYENKYPEQKVVVGTEGYFGTLPDGLQMYLNNNPKIIVIGVGLDLKEIPKSLEESRNAGNATFLVINDSRLKADPSKLGLKLVSEFPKAERIPGTKEYNLNGPREILYLFKVENLSYSN